MKKHLRTFCVAMTLVMAAFSSSAQAAEPLRIMCLGDSITAGYTDNPQWQVPFEFGYRSSLYKKLLAAGYEFKFVGSGAEPWSGIFGTPSNAPAFDLRQLEQDFHRGYGGWGTKEILAHIGAWLATDRPDMVLLMAGINDGGNLDARRNLNDIFQRIVAANPATEVIVAQITPMANYSPTLADYNAYIRETLVPAYQAQGLRVSTVDQYANLLVAGVIDPTRFSNGINHPDAATYDRMAQTWFEGIQRVHPLTP